MGGEAVTGWRDVWALRKESWGWRAVWYSSVRASAVLEQNICVFLGGGEDFQMFSEDFSAIIWAPVNVFGWRGKGRGIWRRGPCTILGLQEKWEAGVAWGQITEMLYYMHLLCFAHLFPGHYVYESPDINMLWEIHHLILGLFTLFIIFIADVHDKPTL